MGNIEVIGKYNLDDNKWTFGNNDNNDISLAVANYESIRNNDSTKYDYIIYCYGSRVENHSKDAYNIKEKQAYVNNIINYFKSKNHNIIIKFVMLDKDAPLKEDGIILANYINNICNRDDCNSVNILGYSKSGVMFFNMIKYIDINNRGKINLYDIATPYLGTKMASPKFIYNDIKLFIDRHIPNKTLATNVYSWLIKFYEGISSNSHMDYDISLPNGIPDNKLKNYDENLIKNLMHNDNIDAIKSINRFQNFTTGIDDSTLKRALITGNYIGVGMCIINDLFMNKSSDGFVPLSSEDIIPQYFDTKNINLKGAHHLFISDNEYYNDVLYQINKNLEEDSEKKLLKKHF